MSKSLETEGFFIHLPRIFVREGRDAYSLVHFQSFEQIEDEFTPVDCPANWSREAAEIFSAAALPIPGALCAIEENTVPSWLWSHALKNKKNPAPDITERGADQIFNRVVGAATFAGWKEKLFANEDEAKTFYNEARYALTQRIIGLPPTLLKSFGSEWAYGRIADKPRSPRPGTPDNSQSSLNSLHNQEIDAIVGGFAKAPIRTKWRRLTSIRPRLPLTITFPDTTADWSANADHRAPGLIDLMGCRHNDGSLNIEVVRHATRLLVLLLDLSDAATTKLSIGYNNLAPLLMALTIPYDSPAARATAAAISAIVTAEAYLMSSELAAMRGMHADFPAHHERCMRQLRNHVRAAHGDRSDYEKLSVLPVPLSLQNCPDLALIAAAQTRWEETLRCVQRFGLRHTHVSALSMSPEMALFMQSVSRGIEPLRDFRLSSTETAENENFGVQSFVGEALARLGYDRNKIPEILRYIGGHKSLASAPHINHKSLRIAGFTQDAIDEVEGYLPRVRDIRLAFTPWVLGESFCREVLKIRARKLVTPDFNLLKHLGFTDAKILAANSFCYGRTDLTQSPLLAAKHRDLFVVGALISKNARLTMAAAVQSFISDDVSAELTVEGTPAPDKVGKFILDAWRSGLHSITFDFIDQSSTGFATNVKDGPTKNARKSATGVRRKSISPHASLLINARSPTIPDRKIRSKAGRVATLTKKPAPSASSKRQ